MDFIEQRDALLRETAEIFTIPSEVREKAFFHLGSNEVEWRSVVTKRARSISDGHEGCDAFEMEESAYGWGHKLLSDNPRKVKGFRISPEAFLQAITTQSVGDLSWTKVLRGIPPGATSLGATYELASRCWIVYVEHESFPEVETGVRAPLCEIVFQQMNFEGLIHRLVEINRLVEQMDDDELSGKIRPYIKAIMKLYFPEEDLDICD